MHAQRVVESDEHQSNGLPSTLVEVEIQSGSSRHRIRIPQLEIHRVRNILLKGEYALPARNFVPSSPVVMDVGANVGLFALYMKLLHPSCVVHCYEPVPVTLALLQNNLNALGDVRIHPYALGANDGEQQIFLHRRNTGQHSLKRIEGDKHYQGALEIPIRNSGREFDALDQEHIDILKIDTEGCEIEILESLGSRLSKVSYVLIEYHSDDDRRKIDNLLSQFSICGAAGIQVNRGTLKYQNRSAGKSSLRPS